LFLIEVEVEETNQNLKVANHHSLNYLSAEASIIGSGLRLAHLDQLTFDLTGLSRGS
jgi:hypothetical protein